MFETNLVAKELRAGEFYDQRETEQGIAKQSEQARNELSEPVSETK